jgi:hypothetical protein
MSYTFNDQLNKLSSLLGDPNTSSDDMWPLAIRKKEINRGELAFAKDSHLLKEYATGTVASMEISVPSDWLETYILIIDNYIITNDREISLADWERYYNWNGDIPYYYFWEFSGTRKIKLLGNSTNINGDTYYFYYFKKPTTELSDAADVSLFPEEYREASVYKAAAELLEQIAKTQLADRYRLAYQALVAQAIIEGEKHFIDKQYPRPDKGGDENSSSVDIEGKGYQF